MRRLEYRSVQRLNDAALDRRLQNIQASREERIAELRETERGYIQRFLAEKPRPDAFASEIDLDSSLAQVDRDLLVNEIFALDVKRRRRVRREAKKPAPKAMPRLSPDFVRALPPAAFADLGKDLIDIKSELVSLRHGTYDPDYWRGVLSDDSDPVKFYVRRGISDSALENLEFKSFSELESRWIVNRIVWGLEAKRRREGAS
jgi:hypothetical protein